MSNSLGLNTADIINIIQLGLSGLTFLFVLMSFHLLHAEQKREGFPRAKMLEAIEKFSRVCLIFAVVVGLFGLLDLTFDKKENKSSETQDKTVSLNADPCHEAAERVLRLSSAPNHDVDSLKDLIRNQLTPCMDE